MLIRNATVVSMDPEIGDLRGDVLVEDDRIAAVGPDLTAPGHSGDDILDATGCLVVPGFVDTHRHMWEGALRGAVTGGSLDDYFHRILLGVGPRMTPDDLAVSEALSARASLQAGITTVQDTSDIHSGPERTDAIVGALQDSGLRTVFAYGRDRPTILREGSALPDDVRRVRSALLPDDDALVTMALSTSNGGDDDERHNAKLAAELGVRTAHHVRAGITPTRLHGLGALRPGTTFVHGNGLDRTDLDLIRDSGGTLSIAPLVEDVLGLGRPMIVEARAADVPVALSIDIEGTAPTDMFTQMRTLYATARSADPDTTITPREILRHATRDGATALGLDARTGSLTPGKQADLLVLRADRADVTPVRDPYTSVVLQMDRSHVDTVLVAGRVHKRDGRPTTDDTDLRQRAADVARRLVPAT